jgi:hypothetical protein
VALNPERLVVQNLLGAVLLLIQELKPKTTALAAEPKEVSCQFLYLSPGVQTGIMVRAITEQVH